MPTTETLDSFVATFNAFASICVPADPAAITAFGIPDVDAGSLTRPLVGPYFDPFGAQVVRFYREGTRMQPFNFQITEQDGITLGNELNLQAQALGSTSFAALFAANRPAAEGIVGAILGGTCTPLDPLSGGTAGIQYLGVVGNFVVQLAYYNNFPEHTLRNNSLREGGGDPIYTDAGNLIATPNNRPPGFGGTATFVSGADYLCYPYPLRKVLEDNYATSFLEWQNSLISDAAYTTLLADWNTGAILGLGT